MIERLNNKHADHDQSFDPSRSYQSDASSNKKANQQLTYELVDNPIFVTHENATDGAVDMEHTESVLIQCAKVEDS